jgi:DNA-binding XRE family transcriptional regulator
MTTTATIGPKTIAYIRQQLGLAAVDLDSLLQVPEGTVEDAEADRVPLQPDVVLRLRHQVKIREHAGTLPEQRHIGTLLRQARTAMGLTQSEVAERVGMNQSTYARLEQSAGPKLATIQRIATALEIPVDWILRGTTPLTRSGEGAILPSTDSPTSSQHQHGG